jgi:hypothetical protein
MRGVILPYIPDEVRYVLKEHRDAEREGEPVPIWYFRPLTLKEQAKVQDGAVRARVSRRAGDGDDEADSSLDILAAQQEYHVLMTNLVRVEGLRGYNEHGEVVDLELPAPGLGGVHARNRELVLRRLKPAWRRELAKAIMDDTWLTEEEEKN